METSAAQTAPTGVAGPPSFELPPQDHARAMRNGNIVMALDRPEENGGPLTMPGLVTGWAYSRLGIVSVLVFVDDVALAAQYGQSRGDVSSFLMEPAAVKSGFSTILHDAACVPGHHQLTVVATDRAHQTVGLSFPLELRATEEGEAPPPFADAGPEPPQPRLDNGGERYVPELHRGSLMAPEHHARYEWAAPLADDRDVLDAGCGVGWGTARLLAGGAQTATGLDLDELAIQSARERAPDATFVRGDLSSLPFDDASFDLVVCFEAIEHVDDPEQVLDELRRVLRKDGLLAVSTPNRGVYPPINPFHLHELTSSELATSLEARFAHVKVYRQMAHLGSVLADESGQGADDPTIELDARVFKLSASEPGDELYAVALAADVELPSMQNIVAVTRPLDVKVMYEQLAMLEHRALVAEAERAATMGHLATINFDLERAMTRAYETERALAESEAARHIADGVLAQHRASMSWKLTAPLRAAKQEAIARRQRSKG